MPNSKNKIDQLHDQLPRIFNSRTNANWKAVVEAIGENDNNTAQLIEEVRKQFFVKTAARPYLDRLAANNVISRPKFVGMDDPTFRQYIPILAYQPKQVKLIIDSLLDIFFFKESTTAFVQTISNSPFYLEDGWELEYLVDNLNIDRVLFRTEEFSNINIATADEVVAAINRQTKHSFAISYYDSITKQTYIRIFTNTVGSRGSIEMVGGRAMIGLKPTGFLENSGNGTNTQWSVSKIGDLVTFEHIGGNSPGIEFLRKGDIIVSDIPGNSGSFKIVSVDISANKISFNNLFATIGIFAQTSDNDTKFIRPSKFAVYKQDRRAMTWEVEQGNIIVETPTSPPVVKRELKGSIHVNGPVSLMSSRDSDSSLTMEDASLFPTVGSFEMELVRELQTKVLNNTENTIISKTINERLIGEKVIYTYTGKSGNQLTGITPNLPAQSTLNEETLSVVTSTGSVVTATTTTPHTYTTGSKVIISASSGILANITTGDTTLSQPFINNLVSTSNIQLGSLVTGLGVPPETMVVGIIGNNVQISKNASTTATGTTFNFYDDINGERTVTTVTSTTFDFNLAGAAGSATTPGSTHQEVIGIAGSGSKIILNKSQKDTKITGPYIYDLKAPFVLSSLTANISDEIRAGKIVRTLNIGPNNLSATEGFVVFDYGQNTQEGPVRYLYKASANTLILDPSYVFQKNHMIGSAVTAIRRKGPPTISPNGKEYAGYITDPAVAREVLQDLILSVKSAGIFVEFLIRYPENLYGTLDIYSSGVDPDA